MAKLRVLQALSSLAAAAVLATSASVAAADGAPAWERNNNWTVEITNRPQFTTGYYFVTLQLVGPRWEITGIYERVPDIPRSQPVELFVVSKDLQRWGNVYVNSIGNCDSFEVKEADFHSVCTSALSEKQSAGAAAVGLFFGGGAKRPVSYNIQLVTAAVQSISVTQATAALSAFENSPGSYNP